MGYRSRALALHQEITEYLDTRFSNLVRDIQEQPSHYEVNPEQKRAVGEPAYIKFSSSSKDEVIAHYYTDKDGLSLSRGGDLPAVIEQGKKEYWVNGQLSRVTGPALADPGSGRQIDAISGRILQVKEHHDTYSVDMKYSNGLPSAYLMVDYQEKKIVEEVLNEQGLSSTRGPAAFVRDLGGGPDSPSRGPREEHFFLNNHEYSKEQWSVAVDQLRETDKANRLVILTQTKLNFTDNSPQEITKEQQYFQALTEYLGVDQIPLHPQSGPDKIDAYVDISFQNISEEDRQVIRENLTGMMHALKSERVQDHVVTSDLDIPDESENGPEEISR
jgi:hypothetical protein